MTDWSTNMRVHFATKQLDVVITDDRGQCVYELHLPQASFTGDLSQLPQMLGEIAGFSPEQMEVLTNVRRATD